MAIHKIPLGAVIAIALTGLFLTILTAGLLTSSQTVPSTGNISSIGVGVFTDSTCALNCTGINWGNLAPGTSVSRAVYIKNTGSVPVTLSMTTSSWSPAAANGYLSLTWDRSNYVLAAGNSVSAIVTLTASSSAGSISSFGFNIVFTGTQQ